MGVLARGDEGLNATRAELQGMGVRVAAIQTDVARADEVRRAAERVEEELGPIDVWVNNAMVTVFSPVAMLTAEEFSSRHGCDLPWHRARHDRRGHRACRCGTGA